MKTAYELAMERLQQNDPQQPLSDEQRRRLAELDSEYEAKIAEREVFLKQKLAEAQAKGDQEAIASLERQMADNRQQMEAERDQEKEKVRRGNQSSS